LRMEHYPEKFSALRNTSQQVAHGNLCFCNFGSFFLQKESGNGLHFI